MKTKLLKSLLAIACLLCSIGVYAHDFEVDGIFYDYYGWTGENEVSVTYKGSSSDSFIEYTGSVVIPDSVTFNGTTYKVISIGFSAFHGCIGLTSLTIPESITSIDYRAFYQCTGLTSLTIPESVTSIGERAFENCTGLISITIPESVTSIGEGIFQRCTRLTSIKVVEGNTVYDSRDNCNALIHTATNTLIAGCKNTTIPNTITTIDDRAFYQCTGLTSITIPEGVTSIGEGTFYNCTGLTSITIPQSVNSIGDLAFEYCVGLSEIRVHATAPPVCGVYVFYFDLKHIPVYVPKGSGEAYKSAVGWSEFTNIIEEGSTEPLPESTRIYVDGIYYQVTSSTDKTVGVTYKGSSYDSYKEYAGAVVIPESITYHGITYKVTSIGIYAFYGCNALTSITLPESVTVIGYDAFAYCI